MVRGTARALKLYSQARRPTDLVYDNTGPPVGPCTVRAYVLCTTSNRTYHRPNSPGAPTWPCPWKCTGPWAHAHAYALPLHHKVTDTSIICLRQQLTRRTDLFLPMALLDPAEPTGGPSREWCPAGWCGCRWGCAPGSAAAGSGAEPAAYAASPPPVVLTRDAEPELPGDRQPLLLRRGSMCAEPLPAWSAAPETLALAKGLVVAAPAAEPCAANSAGELGRDMDPPAPKAAAAAIAARLARELDRDRAVAPPAPPAAAAAMAARLALEDCRARPAAVMAAPLPPDGATPPPGRGGGRKSCMVWNLDQSTTGWPALVPVEPVDRICGEGRGRAQETLGCSIAAIRCRSKEPESNCEVAREAQCPQGM